LTHRPIHGCDARIAEGEQDFLGPTGSTALQLGNRLTQSRETKIFLPFGSIHPIQKGGEIKNLASGFHEIQIQDLLARHKFYSKTYNTTFQIAHRKTNVCYFGIAD